MAAVVDVTVTDERSGKSVRPRTHVLYDGEEPPAALLRSAALFVTLSADGRTVESVEQLAPPASGRAPECTTSIDEHNTVHVHVRGDFQPPAPPSDAGTASAATTTGGGAAAADEESGGVDLVAAFDAKLNEARSLLLSSETVQLVDFLRHFHANGAARPGADAAPPVLAGSIDAAVQAEEVAAEEESDSWPSEAAGRSGFRLDSPAVAAAAPSGQRAVAQHRVLRLGHSISESLAATAPGAGRIRPPAVSLPSGNPFLRRSVSHPALQIWSPNGSGTRPAPLSSPAQAPRTGPILRHREVGAWESGESADAITGAADGAADGAGTDADDDAPPSSSVLFLEPVEAPQAASSPPTLSVDGGPPPVVIRRTMRAADADA